MIATVIVYFPNNNPRSWTTCAQHYTTAWHARQQTPLGRVFRDDNLQKQGGGAQNTTKYVGFGSKPSRLFPRRHRSSVTPCTLPRCREKIGLEFRPEGVWYLARMWHIMQRAHTRRLTRPPISIAWVTIYGSQNDWAIPVLLMNGIIRNITRPLDFQADVINNGGTANAERCVYGSILSRSCQSHQFLRVCPLCCAENQPGNSSQGWCYLTISVVLYMRMYHHARDSGVSGWNLIFSGRWYKVSDKVEMWATFEHMITSRGSQSCYGIR